MIYRICSHPIFIVIVFPSLFLLAGAPAKKISRGQGWKRHDFFLGIEFTLSAMSTGLVYIFDGKI
jgi:hypothetical protein